MVSKNKLSYIAFIVVLSLGITFHVRSKNITIQDQLIVVPDEVVHAALALQQHNELVPGVIGQSDTNAAVRLLESMNAFYRDTVRDNLFNDIDAHHDQIINSLRAYKFDSQEMPVSPISLGKNPKKSPMQNNVHALRKLRAYRVIPLLRVAHQLGFCEQILEGLAAQAAISLFSCIRDMHEHEIQEKFLAASDLDLQLPEDKKLFEELDLSLQGLIRKQYILLFHRLLDNKTLSVSPAKIDTFVNGLIDNQIVPNAMAPLRQYSSMKCTECFLRYIMKERSSWLVSLGLKKKTIHDWFLFLPQQVQDHVRLEYWLATKTHFDKQGMEGLNVDDLKKLAQRSLIPPFNNENSYQDIARFWVKNNSKSGLFNKWLLYKKTYTQLPEWLMVLPTDLQREVKRYFRCKMIAASQDVWLGGDTQVNVPISYLIETHVIPLPKSFDDLEAFRNFEQQHPNELAHKYAEFLCGVTDKNAGAIVAKLPPHFRRDVARRFYTISDDINLTKKIFGEMTQSLDDIFSDTSRVGSLIETIIQKKDVEGPYKGFYKLDLSERCINAIREKAFVQFTTIIKQQRDDVAIHVLNLSGNKLETLPKKAFEGLHELKVLDLSDNNLTDLHPDLFKDMPKLQKIILRNNKLSTLSKKQFAKLEHLHVLDLSHNQLTSQDLPNLGDLNLQELYLANNKITQIHNDNNSNIFSWKSDFCDAPEEGTAIGTTLKVLDLSDNKLSFADAPLNQLKSALSKLSAIQYLDLTGNAIESLQDVIECGLPGLKHLLINNNQGLKLPVQKVDVVTLPKLESLQVKNCGIKALQKGNFDSVPKLKYLMLQHNKIEGLGEAFAPLTALKDLYLQGNQLSKIDPKDFASLKELESLHLEGNQIQVIPEHAFRSLAKLQELWLFANNPKFTFDKKGPLNPEETILRASALSDLPLLKYLDLSYNSIALLPDNLLSGNRSLEWMSCAHNKIEEIPAQFLSGLNNLRVLDLEDNRTQKMGVHALYGPSSHLDIYIKGNNVLGMHKFSSDFELSKKIFARYLSKIPGCSYLFGKGATVHAPWREHFPITWKGLKMGAQGSLLVASLMHYPILGYLMIAGWGSLKGGQYIFNRIRDKVEVFKRSMNMEACDVETLLAGEKRHDSMDTYYQKYRELLCDRYTKRATLKVHETLLKKEQK